MQQPINYDDLTRNSYRVEWNKDVLAPVARVVVGDQPSSAFIEINPTDPKPHFLTEEQFIEAIRMNEEEMGKPF